MLLKLMSLVTFYVENVAIKKVEKCCVREFCRTRILLLMVKTAHCIDKQTEA